MQMREPTGKKADDQVHMSLNKLEYRGKPNIIDVAVGTTLLEAAQGQDLYILDMFCISMQRAVGQSVQLKCKVSWIVVQPCL